jgi:hypothetical protein
MIPAKRRHPEAQLQRAAMQWLQLALVPPAFATSIETGRASRLARMMDAARGVQPGFPDALVFWPVSLSPLAALQLGRGFCGVLGLEFKSAAGRTSPAQVVMATKLRQCHIRVYTIRSLDQLAAACQLEGVPMRRTIIGDANAAVRASRLAGA